MNIKEPHVFIGVPTFKRPIMLQRALKSIFNQNYSNYTVLVSDNSPSLESEQVVKDFNDSRFNYYGQPRNLGLVGNWNYLKQAATKEYWALLEDDNFWNPNHLQLAIKALSTSDSIKLFFSPSNDYWENNGILTPKKMSSNYSQLYSIDEADNKTKELNQVIEYNVENPYSDSFKWLLGSRCPSSSVVIKSNILQQLESFDNELPFAHDYLMWATIGTTHSTAVSRNATVNYTYHGGNAVDKLIYSRQASRQLREVRRKIARLILEKKSAEMLTQQLLDRSTDSQASQIISALGGSNIKKEILIAKTLWENKRKNSSKFSGHTQVANLLGFWYFNYCDICDIIIGKSRSIKTQIRNKLQKV